MKTLECRYTGRCGGCSWAGRDLNSQYQEKLASVRALFPEVNFVFSPENRVRDKVDLVWEEGRLGLYGPRAEEGRPAIVDLDACPMMTEPLEAFFRAYRERKPPIRKGSVRLRVSPAGERGVWLDFANQDVKTLFDEREYLRWLSELAFVEIGQRRKALVWKDGAPKLTDPVLKPWFETYDGEGRAIPLYGPVGGFSQTGFASNRALVAAVAQAAEKSGVRGWLELFCGNGNLTLALATRGFDVEAVEMDELALQGLSLSAEKMNLSNPPRVHSKDVYLKSKTLPATGGRGLLVDPPRAGLRQMLEVLAAADERPRALIYVSCFTDVFVQDVERLRELGYQVADLVGVDQFPHSPHAEWVALLTHA